MSAEAINSVKIQYNRVDAVAKASVRAHAESREASKSEPPMRDAPRQTVEDKSPPPERSVDIRA